MFENAALFLTGLGEIWFAGYAYSNGRLFSVTSGTNSAEYSYLAKSPLVENIVFKQNGTTRMTTTKSYDLLNRLTSIQSINSQPSTINSFAYTYNSANQRTAVTNADNSRWAYGYDKLGQVTSGKKYWSDGAAVSGQQFDYTFDDIGNRRTATRDTRQSDYTVNLLNQYSQRTLPGYVNVLGEATNAATVTVNFTAASRKGDYFRAELPVNNSSPLWQALTNLAVLNQGTNDDIISTNLGRMLIPQTPEAFTFDSDGNLTSDSLWTNTWNAENRRISIESRSGVPTAGKIKEDWTYLPDGRWVERIVSTNNGSYVAIQTNRYVWDGNVLLAVLNHTNGLELAFMRGLDLSGTLQGAGGVGGLLAVVVGPAVPSAPLANTAHFACFDGNCNVAALVNAADGTESARYEYGPFNEPLRITGVMGKVNPIRFSTQYADDFTGDTKYLYRDLRDGRWLSRDPIEERGGLNLYLSAAGNLVNNIDALGLTGGGTIGATTPGYWEIMKWVGAVEAGGMVIAPPGPLPTIPEIQNPRDHPNEQPQPTPQPEPEPKLKPILPPIYTKPKKCPCKVMRVEQSGGDSYHNKYAASLQAGLESDFLVTTPGGLSAKFDAAYPVMAEKTVVEAKTRHGFLLNDNPNPMALLSLDEQFSRFSAVANICGFKFIIAVDNLSGYNGLKRHFPGYNIQYVSFQGGPQ